MRNQGIPWERIYSKRREKGVTELELRAVAHGVGVRVWILQLRMTSSSPQWIDV